MGLPAKSRVMTNETNTLVANLVRRTKSPDPTIAAEAQAELDRLTVQFTHSKRSGVETR